MHLFGFCEFCEEHGWRTAFIEMMKVQDEKQQQEEARCLEREDQRRHKEELRWLEMEARRRLKKRNDVWLWRKNDEVGGTKTQQVRAANATEA